MRSNKILIGVVLVLIGLFSLVTHFLHINYGLLTLFVVGVALILLYRTKRKKWSLVAGGYVIYFALAFAVHGTALAGIFPSAVAAMFFIVPGIIFLALWFDTRKKGLLLPGSLLAWIGVCAIICSAAHLHAAGVFTAFLICLGLGFITAHILGRTKQKM